MIADWHFYCKPSEALSVVDFMSTLETGSVNGASRDANYFFIRYYDAAGFHVRFRRMLSVEAMNRVNRHLLRDLPSGVSSWTLRPFEYERAKWGNSNVARSSYLELSHIFSDLVVNLRYVGEYSAELPSVLCSLMLLALDPDTESCESFVRNHFTWWSMTDSQETDFSIDQCSSLNDVDGELLSAIDNHLPLTDLKDRLVRYLETARQAENRQIAYFLHHHMHLIHNRCGMHFSDEAESIFRLCSTLEPLAASLERKYGW